MLGTFQQSHLRIELEASEAAIKESLIRSEQLRQWFPLRLATGLPEQLDQGLKFSSWVGPIAIAHYIELANENCLRFILSGGIDGFHEWMWGEGWIQSRLEGITVLPLNLGQSLSLLQLRQFLNQKRS